MEELPRELWFGTTGPLERVSLKRSIAKLEAAGLCPSWSDIESLLAYLRKCVAELGSYAKCAAVVGATRNTIRDACRGRYVPSFPRLLKWGRRLAGHPADLRGLLLTVDLPQADRELGVIADDGRPPRTSSPLARAGTSPPGQDAEAWLSRSENAAPPGVHALARDNTQGRPTPRHSWNRNRNRNRNSHRDGTRRSAIGAPPTIPGRAGSCPACGSTTPRGVSPPEVRAYTSITQGEHTASAHPDATETPPLGAVSIVAPKSEADRGAVCINEPSI